VAPLPRDPYEACASIARAHYENFPVASALLPRRMRPHVAAVYAYARLADDIADEGQVPVAQRHVRLDEWIARLHAAVEERPFHGVSQLEPDTARAAPLVFEAVGHSIRSLQLPMSLFEDLVSAFRQDTTVLRYGSWVDLLDYCRRSANPVGRLVLRIGGWQPGVLDEASDAVCTALQLTNFWQDLAVDWQRGRLYVPADIYDAEHADPGALDRREMTADWQRALATCAHRTRALFARGRAVCDGVEGRLRYELRLTWLGGVRILDALDAARYDVFCRRIALRRSDWPALLWQAARWRA
jgi:hydroxysqualene synthase